MISFCHRALFVHVPKTGGTSVKHHLVGYDLVHRQEPDPALARSVYTHLGAATLRASLVRQVGAAEAAGYFQFAFVRNPWDRLHSAFRYLDAGGAGTVAALPDAAAVKPFRGDFARFVTEGLDQLVGSIPHLWPQHRWTHDGLDPTAPLDFIGRFERIDDDFAVVADRLGLAGAGRLPHLRAGRHGRYTDHYDARSRAVAAEVYAGDIALFGYRFGA